MREISYHEQFAVAKQYGLPWYAAEIETIKEKTKKTGVSWWLSTTSGVCWRVKTQKISRSFRWIFTFWHVFSRQIWRWYWSSWVPETNYCVSQYLFMEIPKPAFIGNKHHKSLIDSVELSCFVLWKRSQSIYCSSFAYLFFLFLKARSSDPRFMRCRLPDSKPCRRSEAPERRVQAKTLLIILYSLLSPRQRVSVYLYICGRDISCIFWKLIQPVMQCSAFKSTVYRRTWVLIWTSFFSFSFGTSESAGLQAYDGTCE